MGCDSHLGVDVFRSPKCPELIALALCWRRLSQRRSRKSGRQARSQRKYGSPSALGLLPSQVMNGIAIFLTQKKWCWVPKKEWPTQDGPLSGSWRNYSFFELLAGVRQSRGVSAIYTDSGPGCQRGWPTDISAGAKSFGEIRDKEESSCKKQDQGGDDEEACSEVLDDFDFGMMHSHVSYSVATLVPFNWDQPLSQRAIGGSLSAPRPVWYDTQTGAMFRVGFMLGDPPAHWVQVTPKEDTCEQFAGVHLGGALKEELAAFATLAPGEPEHVRLLICFDN